MLGVSESKVVNSEAKASFSSYQLGPLVEAGTLTSLAQLGNPSMVALSLGETSGETGGWTAAPNCVIKFSDGQSLHTITVVPSGPTPPSCN